MKKRKISDRAVDFILTRNVEELRHLKVEQVALSIGADTSYLSRNFKSEQKISMPDFISREKIHRAIFILDKDHNKSIEKLALELGFHKVGDFVSKFKNYLAIEPEKYRDLRKTALTKLN